MVPNLLHKQTLSFTLSQRIKGYFGPYTNLVGKKVCSTWQRNTLRIMILVQKVFGYPDEICYKFNLILILLKSTYLCINNFTLTLPLARLSGSQPTFRLRGEWVGILIVHYCSIPRISVFGYSWEIRIHLGLKFCLRALEQ